PAFAVVGITDNALTVTDNSGNALSSQTITLTITSTNGKTETVEAETDDRGMIFFLFPDSGRSGITRSGQVVLPNDGQLVVKEPGSNADGTEFVIANGNISPVSPMPVMNGHSSFGIGQNIGINVYVGAEAIQFNQDDVIGDEFDDIRRFAGQNEFLSFNDSTDGGEWGGGFEADLELTNLLTFNEWASMSLLFRIGAGGLPDFSGEATVTDNFFSESPTSESFSSSSNGSSSFMETTKVTLEGEAYYFFGIGPLFKFQLPSPGDSTLSFGLTGGYMQLEQDMKITQQARSGGEVFFESSQTENHSGGGWGYQAEARGTTNLFGVDVSLGYGYGCWSILGGDLETHTIFGKFSMPF
ncbi:MAG: hypothetical protein ABGX43_08355, partial [Nitrospinaceae bacterium]